MVAAACKTPAIAYRVPGLRDSVEDMETGILVELGDIEELAKAITWLLADGSLRNRLGENAYRYAQQFSWGRATEDFTKVIKEVSS